MFSVDVVIHSDTIPDKPFDDFKTDIAANVFIFIIIKMNMTDARVCF